MVLAVTISPPSMHSTPSRKSSLRNLGSRSARARMVSLKSRVSAMVVLLFSPLIILPSGQGSFDVVLLALLRTAAKQDHEALAILAKIDTVTRSEIDPAFEHSRTDALHVREITQSEPRQSRCHFGGGLRIQPVKPDRVGAPAVAVVVFPDVDHPS